MRRRLASRSPGALAAAIILLAGAPGAIAASAAADEPEAAVDSRLAIVIGQPSKACGWSGREGEPPLPLIVPVDPDAVQSPAWLLPARECGAGQKVEIVPRLIAPRLSGAADIVATAVRSWLARVETLVRDGSVPFGRLELFTRPDDPDVDPAAWAFLIEKTSTLVRSYLPECRLVAGPVVPGEGGWFDRVEHERLAPYLDGLSVDDSPHLRENIAALEELYPGIPIWVHIEPGGNLLRSLERVHVAEQAGARMASIRSSAGDSKGRAIATFLRELPARYVPDPDPPALAMKDPAAKVPSAFWADTLGPERAILVAPAAPGDSLKFTLGAGQLAKLDAIDLSSGRELSGRIDDNGSTATAPRVTLRGAGGPVLVRYLPAQPGERAEPESVGVVASVELTAAEIIARLRVVEEAQARATSHYTAKATLSYNYRAEALDESIDVTSVNRFYWRGGVGEYEETELYINGARWRGEPPELPFIQPEKVKDVPIEVRMDPSYAYTLAGRGEIDGRPVYILDFEPADQQKGLYSGRIWIDAGSFARRRIRLVQRGLEPPITGNEDLIDYGPPPGVSGNHWVPLRGYRQMLLTILGRSVVVERRVEYSDFVMNGVKFDEARAIAHESGRRISVDDENGFAYLERLPGGGRVRRDASLRNIAFFGGVTLGSPYVSSPVAGLNYFDFDYRGSGTQVDVAWAGPFVQGAWTDPALGDSRWELSTEARLIGVSTNLKRTTDDGHKNAEDLDVLEERAFVTLGHPVGHRSKAEISIGLLYADYSRSSSTGDRMVVPANDLSASATARWRYFLGGVGMEVWGSTSRRFGWEDWGFYRDPNRDPNMPPQTDGDTGTADQDRFTMWGAELSKSWHTTRLSKLGASLTYGAGNGLDRFSRFRIGDFTGVRVKGFNGSDLSFDRGATAEVSWLVTIPRWGISLDFNVDGAVIENREDFAEDPSDIGSAHPSYREYLVGGGLNVAFKGPWGSLISVGVGSRIDSSLSSSRSDPSLKLRIVKTFGEWPWSKAAKARRAGGNAEIGGEGPD